MEIVASFVPRSGSDPRAEVASPPPGATMVEVRADLLRDGADWREVLAASPLPAVLTLRSEAEGGRGPVDPLARQAFFQAAASSEAALVDLEGARDAALLGAVVPPERAVVSAHFLGGVPQDLEQRAAALSALGARFVKVVPAAEGLADVAAVLRLALGFERGPAVARRGIVFASGEAGRATRLLGPLVGAPLAFAAWEEGRSATPGQYAPGELAALVGHLSGRPRRVFAVVGKGVASSLSPRMHAAAYRAMGLPNLFVPLEVKSAEELDRLFLPAGEGMFDELGLPAGGFAVTMPWKGEAARRCTLLAPRAQRAGAANTVLPRPAKVLGDCTDIDGILRVFLESGVALAGQRVVVVGSGGAARAAAVAVQLASAWPLVVARDAAKAEVVARSLGAEAVSAAASSQAVAVINATPAGAGGEPSPLLEALRLPPGAVAVDLVYGRQPTFLAHLAQERGWSYVDGREVLLYQGASQFAAMCGVAPPVRAMAGALGLEEVAA
jgi:shikimate dehydrogenase/3-dehydroquinate dehydratase type I